MVLSEVLNELSTTTLFVERERGDVEFDSIRIFIFLFETQLNVNLIILTPKLILKNMIKTVDRRRKKR